jgi:ADP-ribose pyrophosphatase YjhB (NUDIX family)
MEKSIRPIAICVFLDADRILVSESYDSERKRSYCRPLGGGIEFGERAEDGVRREITEETGQEIDCVRLLGVIENLFTLEGELGHEIVFVFDARFRDASLYDREAIEGTEHGAGPFLATWKDLSDFDSNSPLVPDGLLGLLLNDVPEGRDEVVTEVV